MTSCLAISGAQHARLAKHLLPPDGREAAAILLCATDGTDAPSLFVRQILPVPYDACRVREPDLIIWPGADLAAAQEVAEDEGLTIVLAHSHPGGFFDFSHTDDVSDAEVMRHLFQGWCGQPPAAIGSAIMVPGGAMRARVYSAEGERRNLTVRVAGDDIRHFHPNGDGRVAIMAFGDKMTAELGRRTACVIGVSGTGSIVAEQAARLGFGRIILIDFDHVEERNLNRIINATIEDAVARRSKVALFAEIIGRYRRDVIVDPVEANILDRKAVLAAAGADVIFSCVDSSEGRQVADLIAQAFLAPLVDVGVTIPTRHADGNGVAIAEAIGRVDYVHPGRSSLGSRLVYTPDSLRAEYLLRVAPDAAADEIAEGYIKGVHQEAPAVISLNMRAASAAVLEYIARAFPYRHEPNDRYARTLFRLAEMEEEHFPEGSFDPAASVIVGTGAAEPLLGLPAL